VLLVTLTIGEDGLGETGKHGKKVEMKERMGRKGGDAAILKSRHLQL